MPSPEYFTVGRVRRAHGIQGELVVESLTDAPEAIFASGRRVFIGSAAGVPLEEGGTATIEEARPFKGGWIVAIEGVADRNSSERWRDLTFLVPADELEPPAEGELYLHEFPGMRVQLASGDALGMVDAVYELPQGLAIDVERPGGKSVVIPYDERTVVSVSREERLIVVDPPEGLLD